MKNQIKILILVLITIVFLSKPTISFAHVLKSDGNIGAVMHISPDDDPIVGQEADFFFEVKDSDNKFISSDCSCQVTILKNNQQVYTNQLNYGSGKNNQNSLSFSYTFPEKAIYKLKITGNSVNTVSFKPFTFSYDLRVTRESSNKTTSNFFTNNIHFVLLGLIVIIFLSITYWDKFSKIIKKQK